MCPRMHRGEAPDTATPGRTGSVKRLVKLSCDFKVKEKFASSDCTGGTAYAKAWRSVRT